MEMKRILKIIKLFSAVTFVVILSGMIQLAIEEKDMPVITPEVKESFTESLLETYEPLERKSESTVKAKESPKINEQHTESQTPDSDDEPVESEMIEIEERSVSDIEWDLAFQHSTKREYTNFLIDFEDGIAVYYSRRGKTVGKVYVGKVSGSLDDILDVVWETDDGEEWHHYFTWKYPDKPNSRMVSELNAEGEEQYGTYWIESIESVVRYVKNYTLD